MRRLQLHFPRHLLEGHYSGVSGLRSAIMVPWRIWCDTSSTVGHSLLTSVAKPLLHNRVHKMKTTPEDYKNCQTSEAAKRFGSKKMKKKDTLERGQVIDSCSFQNKSSSHILDPQQF